MKERFEATVTIRMPKPLLERVEAAGARFYRTPASMIREAIVIWLDSHAIPARRINQTDAPENLLVVDEVGRVVQQKLADTVSSRPPRPGSHD